MISTQQIEPITQTRKPRIHRGAAIMLISAALFAVMAALVKYATRAGAPPAEVTLARFSFGLVTMLVLVSTRVVKIGTQRPLLVAGRGLFGASAILLFFYSIANTSVTRSNLLSYLWVIYAPFLSIVILRERLGIFLIGLLVASFGGVWLITNPGFGGFCVGDLYGIGSAILSAVAILIIRELRRTDSAFTIFTSLSLFGTLIALAMMKIDPKPVAHHPIALLLAVGLVSTIAQLMMTHAYRWCTAAEGSIISMLSPALGAAFGILLFGDPLSWRVILGGAVILGSGVYLTLRPNPDKT